MAKDPAFLFYSSDFLTGTMLMNMEQKGKYITLLCLQHQKGHLTEKDMLSICSAYDVEIWAKFMVDEGGMYYNNRLEMEVERRKKYTESRRNNAKQPKKQLDTSKKAHAKHMPKHMENENENINDTVVNIEFDVFWNLYDKKVGEKVKLKKKWCSLTNDEREAIIAYLPEYLRSQPDKKYRKNPETFLNNKSWNDEIIKTSSHGTATHLTPIAGNKRDAGALQALANAQRAFNALAVNAGRTNGNCT